MTIANHMKVFSSYPVEENSNKGKFTILYFKWIEALLVFSSIIIIM